MRHRPDDKHVDATSTAVGSAELAVSSFTFSFPPPQSQSLGRGEAEGERRKSFQISQGHLEFSETVRADCL